MKKYRVLVLTDHRGHSRENSIYALLRAMVQHERCASVAVASRGVPENAGFFNEKASEDTLWAISVTSEFDFDPTGEVFADRLQRIYPNTVDMLFLRLPRPITDSFLLGLERIFPRQVIINHPRGILATSTKAFLLQFPQLCPPMRLCTSIAEVAEMVTEQGAIVLKPLREYGGKGILKIEADQVDDGQQSIAWEDFRPRLAKRLSEEAMLGMSFLKNVDQGDKRILVVNGEIMAASLRIPAAGSWLCNVAQGGRSIGSEPTQEEVHIVETIAPILRTAGILIYGVDTLVGDNGQRVLSEVNTLSIGGFPQAEVQTGRPIIHQTLAHLFAYADQ